MTGIAAVAVFGRDAVTAGYLRTIFELNKRYGFTKFVIIVPSVAIKEGVYHSIEMAAEHLKGLYAGVPFDYFLYDSAKLGQVRNFATSPQIQIMIMTVGAINKFGDEQQAQAEEADEAARKAKSKNVMYRKSEKTGGEKPIDLIRATRPILIVDEPQSVEGGLDGKGKKAMERMSPLCNLRYSATPKESQHMVFKLDAVDAYERKLVKQIEVAAASVEGGHNKPYVKLLSVSSKRGTVSAKVELDVQVAGRVTRQEVTVLHDQDLEMTTGRAVYHDCRIGEIRVAKGDQFMELRVPGGEEYLRIGQAHGDVEPLAVQRQMIHRTIKEHLEKENRYKDLLKKSREATVNAETWDQLERDLADQSKAHRTLEDEIDRISREIAWIDRCEDALPSVGRLNDEMKSLSQLPALPEVASDFVERAKSARTSAGESGGRVQTLTERISQLDHQLMNCVTSPEVLANAETLDLLHQELGAYREQKKTLSKLKQELAGIEPNLLAGMKSLEVSGGFETLETLRLSSAVRLSIEEAAKALLSALSNQSAHGAQAEELKTDIELAEAELTLLPETDLAPLREALADAAEATEANKTLAISRMAVDQLIRSTAAERALVPGVPEDPDVASKLTVPAPATIRKYRERLTNLERDIEVANNLIRDTNETVCTLENELQRLERRGELPSEESLKQARDHRDHGWQLVLADWKGDGAQEEFDHASPLEEAFPHAIIRADNIADQLRLDAEAVAQAEEKRLQVQNSQKKITEAKETLASLQREIEECQALWESEWAPIGVAPRSPDEMEEWREKWVGLRETISKLRDAEAEFSSKSAKVEKASNTLATALLESQDKPFSVLFEAARIRVQKGEESTGQRKEIGKRLEKLKKDLASLDRKSAGLFPAVQAAEASWKLRCRSAGLLEDTTPEAGLRLLQERKELLAKFDSWTKLFGEAEIAEAWIQQYEQSVSACAKSLGIEADLTESQEAGLWKALSDARNKQARHDQLTSQIAGARTELSDAKSEETKAMEALQELMRVSKLEDLEELEPLIANLEKCKIIQDRIYGHRETLNGLARGQALDNFITRVQSENADDLPMRKTQLEASKRTKNADLQGVQSLLDGLNRQKKELEKAGDEAADFRQQAESVAAKMKQDASRYIRLRLAAHFLRNQIERFREENQGPLLEKSGQVFKQMTRDAFDGLAAEFNDEDIPVMVGRRTNGANVPVEGMSDGSRDQLYLSLRLAAMDRYLEEHEPMPFILDDLLITFDNERTKAILPQLVNLAKRTQIFLFTHHEHLVELCHEIVDKGHFMQHRLGASNNGRPC